MAVELDFLDENTPVGTFRCSGGVGLSALQEFLQQHALESREKHLIATVVAVEDEIVVGYIAYRLTTLTLQYGDHQRLDVDFDLAQAAPGVEITYLAVADGCRGQGIGTLLMEYLLKLVFELQQRFPCRVLSVVAYQDAIPFYAGFGFEKAAVEAQWYQGVNEGTENEVDDSPPLTYMYADLQSPG